MQKCINLFFVILIVTLNLLSSNASSQSISYEVAEGETGLDIIRITPSVPVGYKFCRFEFDVPPKEVLEDDEGYIFSSALDEIKVTLYYTLESGDCTAATSAEISMYPRAHFTVEFDSELNSLASLKRVLRRSSSRIDDNRFEDIGNYRFFWTFDEKMDPKPEVDFDANDLSLGQYPNVYYTFPNGGEYEITLKVVDITSSVTSSFTRIISLNPVFESDLIDFEYIPNVFTPNESTNNFFTVESSGTSQLAFKVFTRSGALVYEHKGNIIKWDGKNYYGTDLPTGVYYYIIDDVGSPKNYNTAKGFFYIYR
ncbi:MAG: gliding motility-associated C-terminal domain-containing protein [Tenuifilaceae bacterium]|nr:gliding motility-associated C-terminal domain-containing protein [Tenuifilaceae bacterium]